MLGAIIGDIVGSRFEWDNIKKKDFNLFTEECFFTDDSVMSLAVAKAILEGGDISEGAVSWMRELGRRYPDCGYGGHFETWLVEENPKPYNSFGNGAGMRVSPCGFAASTLEEAKALARSVTEVTHNHPEGLKGAEAIAVGVFLLGNGVKPKEFRKLIESDYYKLDFTLDELRPDYEFDVSCQGSVPQAIEAFLESESFEDAIRNAISLGGDSDTIAAMTGALAEAWYGIPDDLRSEALKYLTKDLREILFEFEERFGK